MDSDSAARNWCIYMHTFPDGKKYIGITKRDPEKRWLGGNGYTTDIMKEYIKKYGWENVKHDILLMGLTEEEARAKEKELIRKENRTATLNIAEKGSAKKILTKGLKILYDDARTHNVYERFREKFGAYQVMLIVEPDRLVAKCAKYEDGYYEFFDAVNKRSIKDMYVDEFYEWLESDIELTKQDVVRISHEEMDRTVQSTL